MFSVLVLRVGISVDAKSVQSQGAPGRRLTRQDQPPLTAASVIWNECVLVIGSEAVRGSAVGCIDWLGLSCRYVDAADDLALAQLPMAMNSFDDERLLYVLGTFALLAMIDVNQIGTLNINAVNGM